MVKTFDEYMTDLNEQNEIKTVDLPTEWETGLVEGKFDEYDDETKALIEKYIAENQDTKFVEITEDLGLLEFNDAIDAECEVSRYVVEFTEAE